MIGFINKKIQNIQTLGEKLEKHRHRIGLSREKAARAININARYIKYLETDNYSDMPPDVYATNILKSYAGLLSLNPAMVMDLYEKEKNLYFRTQKSKDRQKISELYKFLNRFLNPRTLKYLLIILLILTMLFYIGWEMNKIVSPPKLTVESPADNLLTDSHQIIVRGQTEKEVLLKINNQPLLSDKQGNFNLTMDLQKGLNIIKISAQKKHSQESVAYRKVIVQDKPE